MRSDFSLTVNSLLCSLFYESCRLRRNQLDYNYESTYSINVDIKSNL